MRVHVVVALVVVVVDVFSFARSSVCVFIFSRLNGAGARNDIDATIRIPWTNKEHLPLLLSSGLVLASLLRFVFVIVFVVV